jgi:diguanylate cyclase (GGDEF)-like protein
MISAKKRLELRLRPALTRPMRARLLALAVVGLVGLMGAGAIVGFLINADERAHLREYRYFTRDVRTFQQALVDAETGIRGFALSQHIEYLEPYVGGLKVLDDLAPAVLPELDVYDVQRAPLDPDSERPSAVLRRLRDAWKGELEPVAGDPLTPADTALFLRRTKEMMDDLRATIAGYVANRSVATDKTEQRIAFQQMVLLFIYPLGALIAIAATSFSFWRGARDSRAREAARHEMEQLFSMASMLQSATDRDDANEVLCGKAQYLLPGFSGALYVFNNSRDRLDRSLAWGSLAPRADADHIAPSACWALKLGKPYINGGRGNLRCPHDSFPGTVLEIPMAARGEIYGLLQITHEAADAEDRLEAVRPLAVALADAMSLSLSGSALRDQLRNQALRDGLTGLYNRRFLEEMLERLTQDAARRAVPMSAIMIDLDHFKRLNDQYGHGTGDAVLREVARIVMAALRVTDVACRYGGEELLLLLPDCPLESAVKLAEKLRVEIETLTSDAAARSITASLGVACTPDTTAQPSELVAVADAALYQAKRHGRNRVEVAPRHIPGAPRVSLVGPGYSPATG